MKPLWLGLTGKAGAGKSTVAEALTRLGMERASFADGIRRCVAAALHPGEPERDDSGRLRIGVPGWLGERKDEPIAPSILHQGIVGQSWFLKRFIAHVARPVRRCVPLVEARGEDSAIERTWREALPSITTGRRLLQVLGTDIARRYLGEDIWVRRWEAEHARDVPRAFVFDDVRFANEAECIRSHGGIIIRLVRTDAESTDCHTSETQEFEVDYHAGAGGGDVFGLVRGVVEAVAERLSADAQAALGGGVT
jgi:energy-coupling factor transporter ATP-binding protein EcfA2